VVEKYVLHPKSQNYVLGTNSLWLRLYSWSGDLLERGWLSVSVDEPHSCLAQVDECWIDYESLNRASNQAQFADLQQKVWAGTCLIKIWSELSRRCLNITWITVHKRMKLIDHDSRQSQIVDVEQRCEGPITTDYLL
jgi:hypothetical protein